MKREHLELLESLRTDENPHTGRTLREHLVATRDLLEEWRNPAHVCVAGLFHSIYGTQHYTIRSASDADRARIAAVIGREAEELAHLFCAIDRRTLFGESAALGVLRDAASGQQIAVSPRTLAALIEIEVANYVEQLGSLVLNDAQRATILESIQHMLVAGRPRMTPSAHAALRASAATIASEVIVPS